jgi:retinol dehydrogenase 12
MVNDLDGKVFLVTGGTEGIGKAVVRVLAKRGATLVLVGRDPLKTARLITDLKAESDNDRIEPIIADLSRFADVRAVSEQFLARYEHLDVLVNSAGAARQWDPSERLSTSSHEPPGTGSARSDSTSAPAPS